MRFLYDWLIEEIQRMADSDIAENFAAGLAATTQAAFITLTERMRGLGADLARAKADRVHFSTWPELRQNVEDFAVQFPTFPELKAKKLQFSTLLAEMIVQAMGPVDAENIDPDLFRVEQLGMSLPFPWFVRENTTFFEDSVAVFSCDDMQALERELANSPISPKLAFHLLAVLHSLPRDPAGLMVLVKNAAPPIGLPAVDAFVRLLILASGKTIHAAKEYPKLPSIVDLNVVRAGNLYHQWNEVLDVLSEYNARKELIVKYLTIYHVIENFMFKLPLVELERQKGGRMFSIRDFKRMYKRVEEREPEALKQLFVAIFRMEPIPGVTFADRIVDRWKALVPPVTLQEIEDAMGSLDIKKDGAPLKHADFRLGGEAPSLFAQMVYAVRNAIVHNKETEFHLTHASLHPAFGQLIELFLLPSLEEVCFHLVGNPNQALWYQNRELLLYQ